MMASHSAINVIFCLFYFLTSYIAIVSADDSIKKEDSHHTSCLTLDDGLQYIRPGYDTNFPSILVRCSSGWTILDYTIDPNIRYYFSSFKQITPNIASMDTSFERKNWNHWLQIKGVDYSISQDCNSCESESDDLNNAYYMTGNYYGCSFATQVLCDMDTNTNQCFQCSLNDDRYSFFDKTLDANVDSVEDEDEDPLYNGICTHVALNINDPDINTEISKHKKCTTWQWNYLPSLGTNGEHCTCFKPKSSRDDWVVDAVYLRDDIDLWEDDGNNNNDIRDGAFLEMEEKPDCDMIYELTNSDFEHGTYRIKQCGHYKLMEDISLNMNGPSEDEMNDEYIPFSPNDVMKYYYLPTWEQQADENEYPSQNFIGPYSLGFFAGISVEANDVIIDLNGYELSMSYDFYLQQRFFSLIELASKPFMDGQGPSNWGNADEFFASNIEIKNGVLGRTSHQAIHGNNNVDIKIHDVSIKDFEISGITMNGFKGLTIKDVDIGPNNQNIPLMPQYAHGRLMLQRLEQITDKMNKFLYIGNLRYTAEDVILQLQNEMDEAFEFSHDDQDEIDEDDEIFENLFINKDGLTRAGSLYGIFLNSVGFNTFGIGQSPGESTDLMLKNINIKDLRSAPLEAVRLKGQHGPFNDIIDIKNIINMEGMYKGNSYSNAQFTLNKLLDDRLWSIRGKTFITDEMMQWVADKRMEMKLNPLGCNNDLMLHQTKGIMAMRIDNVQNIKIDGYINIERLHNLGEFGENMACGKYYSSKNGGHLQQIYPLQIGYTGNEVHGITFIGSEGVIMDNAEISINNLMSARSNVYGIQFYPNSNIKIHTNVNVNINNIHAGAYLTGKDLLTLRSQMVPNTVPRVCLFDIWKQNNAKNKENVEFIGDDINIKSECVTYYDSCSFEYYKIDDSYSYDEILNEDYVTDKDINNKDCVFNIEKASVLSTLSQTSEYNMESLDLLNRKKSQILNKQTDIVFKTAIEKNNNYKDYIKRRLFVGLSIVILAVVVYSWLYRELLTIKGKSNDWNPSSNEQSPLLSK